MLPTRISCETPPVPRRSSSTNVDAIETALKALALEPEHAALVQLARSLASSVDRAPDDANVAREYRQVLDMIAKAGGRGPDDDTAAFTLAVQTPGVRSSVRNAKK